MDGIRCIVGLGNPGPTYEKTRHNAGAWFVNAICRSHHLNLKLDAKRKSHVARLSGALDAHLAIPTTFMNLSGDAVQSLMQFYKLSPENLLVVHDELDLEPGVARLKFKGGHGGHNGLRDIFSKIGSGDFHRLRIGIGHPGGPKGAVTNYVLKPPSKDDAISIDRALDKALDVLPDILAGDFERAMNQLHS